MRRNRRLFWGVCAAVSLTACKGSGRAPAGSGTVTGTIRYSGRVTGVLRIFALLQWPPAVPTTRTCAGVSDCETGQSCVSIVSCADGGPPGCCFAPLPPAGEARVDQPRFPQAFRIEGLAPGEYVIAAGLDAVPNDGLYNDRVDPVGGFGGLPSPTRISVVAGETRSNVDLELCDPGVLPCPPPPCAIPDGGAAVIGRLLYEGPRFQNDKALGALFANACPTGFTLPAATFSIPNPTFPHRYCVGVAAGSYCVAGVLDYCGDETIPDFTRNPTGLAAAPIAVQAGEIKDFGDLRLNLPDAGVGAQPCAAVDGG